MSIHKAQGHTLSRCGVLLPVPVFTHGQLYVCASRANSAGGLRFWLGEATDGHGYHENADGDETHPYTHNVIFPEILQLVLAKPNKDHGPDKRQPHEETTQLVEPVSTHTEYVELAQPDEDVVHKALFRYMVPTHEETGGLHTLVDTACQPLPIDFSNRAALLGVSPSEWHDISKRPQKEIEMFLESEERQPDLGAASSTG